MKRQGDKLYKQEHSQIRISLIPGVVNLAFTYHLEHLFNHLVIIQVNETKRKNKVNINIIWCGIGDQTASKGVCWCFTQ